MSKLSSTDIAFIKQLQTTLVALLEASEKVELHCFDYSNSTEEYQQDCLDMLEFRKMQVDSRATMLLKQLKGD